MKMVEDEVRESAGNGPAAGGAGSHYLTPAVAERAVALVAPMVEAARADPEVVGSGFLYVVVMDPGKPPASASFEDAVLYERAFGDRERWDADYAAFARAKAHLSWRTGRDGRVMQECYPHLLRTGDTVLGGGVCVDGIVVGVSGAFPAFDEAFAGAVAFALRALARHARQAEPAGIALSEAARDPG